MRIWLVQRAESTPHDDNGARRLMRMGLLAQQMASEGHEVVWWTSAFDHTGKTHRHRGSSIRREVLPGYSIHYVEAHGYRKSISLSRLRDNSVVARNFIRDIAAEKDKPDVILASMPSAELALAAANYGLANNIPVVVDIRDLHPDIFRDYAPNPLKPVVDLVSIPMRQTLKELCQKATAITGITQKFRDWALVYAGRLAGHWDRVFLMAYANSDNSTPPDQSAVEFWSGRPLLRDKDCLQLLYLGNVSKSIDFETVLAAARKLDKAHSKVRFTFCGNGDRADYLENEIKSLGNCDYAGWVNAGQIQVALKNSHLGLVPYIQSKNFLDNIPNKPAEYLSGGLAIASSLEKGPLRELLDQSGAGFTYGTDSELFARKIHELEGNRVSLHAMKEKAIDLYRSSFDAKNVYGNFSRYLQEIAASTPERLSSTGA